MYSLRESSDVDIDAFYGLKIQYWIHTIAIAVTLMKDFGTPYDFRDLNIFQFFFHILLIWYYGYGLNLNWLDIQLIACIKIYHLCLYKNSFFWNFSFVFLLFCNRILLDQTICILILHQFQLELQTHIEKFSWYTAVTINLKAKVS